jgi:hypothetical protein
MSDKRRTIEEEDEERKTDRIGFIREYLRRRFPRADVQDEWDVEIRAQSFRVDQGPEKDLLLVKVTGNLLTDANYTFEDIKERLDRWNPGLNRAVLIKSGGMEFL